MGLLKSSTLGTHTATVTGVSVDAAAAVADLGALTAIAAVGATPTDDEYDALLADVTLIHAKVNALLASLRAAGLLDT